MKTINKILYYSIVASVALVCITATTISDICDGIVGMFKRR